MVAFHDMQELLLACALIAGFSITGFFVNANPEVALLPYAEDNQQGPHPILLTSNPVVHITFPAHNIFAP